MPETKGPRPTRRKRRDEESDVLFGSLEDEALPEAQQAASAPRRRRQDPGDAIEALPVRRQDPKPRHIDGSAPWSMLKHRDPGRHYVFAYNNDSESGYECGLQHYLTVGYKVETHERNGVRPAGMSEAQQHDLSGKPVEMRGMTLVSCSKERYEEIQEYGPHGNSGYDVIRERRQKIFRRDSIPGEALNEDPRHFRALNETVIEDR